MAKIEFTQEEKTLAQPLAEFFVSTVGFQQILREQYPRLFNHLLGKYIATTEKKRIEGLQALKASMDQSAPTVMELIEADHKTPELRRTLRRRFLDRMITTYDEYFPRPGGRSADALKRHEAATQKALGMTWRDVSTSQGREHAEEDRGRKLVARDRVELFSACLFLVEECAGSSAPPEVRTEFDKLAQAIREKRGNA